MNRRLFIRCVGGGTVLAATSLSITQPAVAQGMPPESVVDWQGPGSEPDPRRWALGYAILAPNPHNRQPWQVDLRESNVITLYCDKERLLPQTDPLGRQILIGHGCFLELLCIALAEKGFVADVALFPQGEPGNTLAEISTKPVARITLRSGSDRDGLFAAIPRRHTPKEAFDTTRLVSAEIVAKLRAVVNVRVANVGASIDAARVAELRKLAMDAARVEFETERTMMESMRLVRIGPTEINTHRDGININSAFVRFAAAVGMVNRNEFPKPGSTAHGQAISRYEKSTSTAPAFIWLSTVGNARSQQVQSGRAYVRLQLTAVPLGLGVHPLSQALQEFAEMKPFYDRIHQLLLGKPASQETLQLFCRIGYPATPAGPTPRRGVKAIIMA